MASHEAVGGAGEAAVGEKSDGITETCANESRGNGKHFAHARSAAWAFVADHDNVAGFDLVGFDGGERGFFAVEHASGAAEILSVVAGDLDHAAFGSEIAFENDEAAGGLQRIGFGADDFLA